MIGFQKPAPRCKHRWRMILTRVSGVPVKANKQCLGCGRVKPAKLPKPMKMRQPIARGKPPRLVSKKRAPQLREYSVTFRAKIIDRDRGCILGRIEPERCAQLLISDVGYGTGTGRIEVEHVNGRRGEHLLDEWGAVSLHRACHRWVTDHAKEWKPKLRDYLDELRKKSS